MSETSLASSFPAAPPRWAERRSGLLEVVRQFTPNWFTATMGTGILALCVNLAGGTIPALHEAAIALWLFNIALFLAISLLYAARWVLFFGGAKRIFGHSVMSMFFGAIPMGLATIINGFVAFGVPLIGAGWVVRIALPLWWVDVALSLACGLLVPFLMFTRHDHAMERMTAVWLLPIVAAEVAAASGAQIIPLLGDAHLGFTLLLLCYALWAYSVPLAMGVLVVLFLRLVLHRLPHRDMAASGCLALGPIGTGALALLLLGADAPRAAAAIGMPMLGPVAQGIGLIGGVALWGYGLWWLALAVLTTLRYLRREGMPFNLGWWGFTFPLGVYSAATIALAHQTGLLLFSLAGTGFVILLALLWAIVAAGTLRGVLRGTLFHSPCLAQGAVPADAAADIV
ncbi:TDT family transporter [Acidisoma sp. C75]